MNLVDLVGALLGFVFTILVFTYLLGDNFLFRLTIHIFIGVAAAFVAVVALYNVILYQLIFPLYLSPLTALPLLVPLLLGLWLLITKSSARLSKLGNPVMAFLVGAGAATAIGGGVLGTLFPQTTASMNLFANYTGEISFLAFAARGILILVGIVATLAFFHFGARASGNQPPQRQPWIEGLAQVGQYFIAITFGVLFAGVYAAALTAFIERLQFIVNFLRPYLT